MTTEELQGTTAPLGLSLRIGYAFIGLLAGNAVMDAYVLRGLPWALATSSTGVRLSDIVLGVFGVILLFGTFSLIGWLLVGVPVVLFLPIRLVRRLPWAAIFAIAAILGPVAFFPVFLLLFASPFMLDYPVAHSSVQHGWLAAYWLFAFLASIVGFPTYCWLVRRRLSHT